MPQRIIDLNRADSSDLVRLRGIGPVLSARIIKYRNALGGFCAVDQLREVYGMDSLTAGSLRAFLSVDQTAVQKIDLNKAAFKELLHHPYLEYEEVKRIVQYRDKHGTFSATEELFEVGGLDSARVRRILPYLTIIP